MSIVVVGLSHKTAPVEVREKLSFSESEVTDALKTLMRYKGVTESLILSTCNRVEIYACVLDNSRGVEQIKKFISRRQKLSPEALAQSLYVYADAQCVRHAFRVASSLDSMVVGEPQILGQLKDAFDRALIAGTTGTLLNKLLQRAFFVAKRVRTETGIAESAVSISFAAVEFSRKIFGNLEGKTVMLLGGGELAELAARCLQNNGVKSVLVANRTFERAVEFANEFNGSAVRFENFPAEMVMADILICSTGAPTYVIRHDMVSRAIRRRRNKPIFMIDISVPRNIDPEVNKIDNVFLYDIDDLQGVVNSNIENRAKEAEKAEKIIMQEVESYLHWEHALDAVPAIIELRKKVETIRQRELKKTFSHLKGITGYQRKTIEAMSTAMVNKILHSPIVMLKEAASTLESESVFASVRKLFNLGRNGKKSRRKK